MSARFLAMTGGGWRRLAAHFSAPPFTSSRALSTVPYHSPEAPISNQDSTQSQPPQDGHSITSTESPPYQQSMSERAPHYQQRAPATYQQTAPHYPQTAPAPYQQTAPAPYQQTAPAPAPFQQTAPAPFQQTAPAPYQQTAPYYQQMAPAPYQQTAPYYPPAPYQQWAPYYPPTPYQQSHQESSNMTANQHQYHYSQHNFDQIYDYYETEYDLPDSLAHMLKIWRKEFINAPFQTMKETRENVIMNYCLENANILAEKLLN